jgi:hypothetical protein
LTPDVHQKMDQDGSLVHPDLTVSSKPSVHLIKVESQFAADPDHRYAPIKDELADVPFGVPEVVRYPSDIGQGATEPATCRGHKIIL